MCIISSVATELDGIHISHILSNRLVLILSTCWIEISGGK